MNAKMHPDHEAVRAVFGAYPEDVLERLELAAEAFNWIDCILQAAEKKAAPAKPLQAAAKYIATDFSAYITSACDSMRDYLREHDGEAQT